jgi:hypothetical protein
MKQTGLLQVLEAVTLLSHMLKASMAGDGGQEGRKIEGCPAEAYPGS